ncbi:hypothetical protein [Streptomyces sp. NBC_00827]|uniref:hypothetical protein n=1 Tax=Streptomyces sp. NBC_00827 TaxID=2903677 RepID=UPI0038636DE8|nr:hypothetical protein OG569_20045 [Streptomyces sp. NBC_00827]
MTDKLQRPPRPDEELARFHNGDTLDSIPVVRLPIASSRRPSLWWGAVIVPVAVWTAPPPSSESPEAATQAGPEQVSVIQAPTVQGDVATSFCLVYTGSWSGGAREAVLLIEAPAYQCTDLLRYAPEDGGAFSEVPVLCQTPARAAVLSFAESSGWWGGEVYFTCLTRHSGA